MGVALLAFAAWSGSVKAFDHTVRLPTPIYFGWGDAAPTPADYNGDGRDDLAVYFESCGLWHVRTMGGTVLTRTFYMGGPGWRACPADYDGDNKADPAVYGNGVLGVALSSRHYIVETLPLGSCDQVAVPEDYDGDGKADPAVYREMDGQWSALLSTRGYALETVMFGGNALRPAPADYDGDRKADPAIYFSSLGLWTVALSGSGYAVHTTSLDCPDALPVPGDFDGDGKADFAIYQAASGLWLGRLSGSDYAPSYQILGGDGYVPVAGRFYHSHSHTLGVYKPASGEWLVSCPLLPAEEGVGAGGPFGSFLMDLIGGIPGDIRCWGIGWVLDMLTNQNSGEEQIQQYLAYMDNQMNTLLALTSQLQEQLTDLASQLELDQTETENYIMGQNAQAAIDTVTTYYDEYGGDSMATFCSPTFTNTYPDTNTQRMLIGEFANNVEVGNYAMKDSVTTIHNALMPGGFGESGLLWGWTTNFILSAATADSLPYYYLTLENYYAFLYTYLMKGAATYVEAEHYLYSNDFDYVAGTLTPNVNAEVDQFEQCTYKMMLSKADFVNAFSTNPVFISMATATNILSRNMFMAAQARGTNAYGVNAMILATLDAVTNGFPPMIAFYNWLPSPTLEGRREAETGQPPVQYFLPVTSRWIGVTGPSYDYWSNGRMHATNQYAFLQYGFGANVPSGHYLWYFLPRTPFNPSQTYGDAIWTGRYDDSLNGCSTGNLYGFFLTELRNGGPNFFANSGAPYFGATTYTHQVLGETSDQGAYMHVSVQRPTGTNIMVASVTFSNGPLDNKHFNPSQGDITANANALWSFTYDGQTSVTGMLQYKAWTSGSYMVNPPYTSPTYHNDSFVGQIGVFDQTTNGVCANGIVASYAVTNHFYNSKTTVNLGTNTQGSVTVQFLPGHKYAVFAGWNCLSHDANSDNRPPPDRTEAFLYPFVLNVTLGVQGLAITFE